MTWTLFRHELRQGRAALLIWALSIGGLAAMCVLMYPEIEKEMGEMTAMFAQMGAFTAAFSMDRLDIGSLMGFYGIECGNIIGLGGAMYAALCGVSALAKEERGHTAEFLLTHPLGRARVVAAKAAAVFAQVTALNAVVLAITLGAVAAIGQAIPWRDLLLMHLAWWLLGLELAGVCFGISAVLRRGEQGVGLGLAAGMYCVNLMANMTESVRFLKHITPFAYTEAADILLAGELDLALLLPGLGAGAVATGAAFWYYTRKDIAA